jgi:hypothetical protein
MMETEKISETLIPSSVLILLSALEDFSFLSFLSVSVSVDIVVTEQVGLAVILLACSRGMHGSYFGRYIGCPD